MYQIKSIPCQVKDVDVESRTVQGYFSVFGNVDSDSDIIESGAFKKTISERGPAGSGRIKHLWQHNPTMPLAKPKELSEDEVGLSFVSEISDTSYGMDAIKLYRDGVVDEHSIGFEIVKAHSETVDGKDVQVITDIRLWEGSTVTWGANEMARGGMKGISTDWMLERYNILKQALKSGDYTDDTFKLIEKQLSWISTQYIETATQPDTHKEPSTEPDLLEQLQLINLKRDIRNGLKRPNHAGAGEG